MRTIVRKMRILRPLDALLPRTRQAILAATFRDPDRSWYLSDLARRLGVRPSSLQRDLSRLVAGGILQRRTEGNRVYFQADSNLPFFRELSEIIAKTVGLTDVLREALAPFARRIDWAFVYGSVAKSEERASSDIDLMIIGRLGLADLSPALQKAEQALNRALNPVVYAREEFARKLKRRHHFLTTVMQEEKLFVIGRASELAAAFSLKAH